MSQQLYRKVDTHMQVQRKTMPSVFYKSYSKEILSVPTVNGSRKNILFALLTIEELKKKKSLNVSK